MPAPLRPESKRACAIDVTAPPNTPITSDGAARPAAAGEHGRRYKLLLLPGAAGLRGALQEVATLIGYPTDPDCITDQEAGNQQQ